MNNARGATGGACGKVVLVQQKCAASGAGALPRDGNAVDPAADDDDLEVFAFQGSPDCGDVVHFEIRSGA